MSYLLQSKIKSLTAIDTNAPQFLAALDAVATFQATARDPSSNPNQNQNPPATSLRVQLEQQGQLLVEEFLDSFEPLRTKLYDLEHAVQNLDENSQKVETELEKVKAHTSKYVTVLQSLQEEQLVLGRRTKLIEDFLETARLTDKEINTLQRCDLTIDNHIEHFFTCMKKLKHIRSLENVLSTGWARTAGLQLVAKTSSLQSLGYERLFLWIRSNCDILSSRTVLETPSKGTASSSSSSKRKQHVTASQLKHFKQGLHILHDTPAYFEQCCVAIVTKQRAHLRSQFVRALMQGTGAGSPPIEAHNNDPLRFVGDMLAWAHGTIASETDHLWSLFGGTNKVAAGGSGRSGVGGANDVNDTNDANNTNDTNDTNTTSTSTTTTTVPSASVSSPPPPSTTATNSIHSRVEHLLPTAFDDMIRPLKVRINQVARNEENVVRCFQLSDLIQFYYNRLMQLLPIDSMFMVGMEASATKIQSRFHELLQMDSSKLLHSTTIYPSDLSAAQSVQTAIQTVSELCKACSQSISGSTPQPKEGAKEITQDQDQSNQPNHQSLSKINISQVINTLIESIQFACQASASGLGPIERSIYSINNVHFLVEKLMGYDHMAHMHGWIQKLTEERRNTTQTLVQDVATKILDKYHLSQSLEEAKGIEDSTERLATFTLSVVPKMMTFSTQLFRSDDVGKQFHLMATPTLRTEAEHEVHVTLSKAYEVLYTRLKEPGDQLYSSEQVKTLLNV